MNKQQIKEKYTKLAKKYLDTKKILIILLVLVLVLAFSQAFKGILLLIIFLPMAKYSVRATAFIPHVTIETYTASSLLMTYLFGPITGFLSALVLGFYGYLSNGISKFLALVNVFVTSITCFIVGLLVQSHIFGTLSFTIVFSFGIILDNVIAYFVFLVLDPDQLQNRIYRATHILYNLFITQLFFSLIYEIFIKLFPV